MARNPAVEGLLEEAADLSGYDPKILKAFLLTENAQMINDARNENSDGTFDSGLMQINSQHIPWLIKNGIIKDEVDLHDPQTNIRAHIALLDDLKRQGASTPEEFAAGYNTGKFKNLNPNSPYIQKFMNYFKQLGGTGVESQPEQLSGPVDEEGAETSGQSERAGVSTSSRVTGFSVGENSGAIMEALGAAREKLGLAQDKYAEGEKVTRGFGAQIIDAITELGNVTSRAIEGAQALVMKKEAGNKRIAGDFGVDVDVSNDILSTLGSQMQAEGEAHRVALDRYNRLREVSLLDNPIAYLSAQLNIPQAGAQVNSHARNFDAAASTFNTLIESSQKAIQNNNLAAATTDENQAKLLAKSKILESVEAARKVGLLTEKEALEYVGKAATASVTDLHILMGVEKLSIEEATKAYMQSLRGAAEDAKAEERNQLNKSLEKASVVLGLPIDRGSFNKLGAKEKNAVLKVGITGRLGENILDSISNKEYLAPTPENAGVNSILKTAESKIREVRLGISPTVTKAAEINELTNRGVTNAFHLWNNDISWDSANNPYIGPSPAAILNNNPELQAKLPLLLPVLKPMLQTNHPIPPQLLVDTIVKTYATDEKGQLRIPEATAIMEISKELDTYYGAVIKNNNQTFRYGTLSLPSQTSYNARIKGVKGSVDGSVNFNNPIETSNALYGSIVQYFRSNFDFTNLEKSKGQIKPFMQNQ